MATDVYSKKFNFFNIVPVCFGSEEQTAAEIIEYYEKTGNEVALLSAALHPEGDDVMAKPLAILDNYRKIKKLLAGTPVKFGLLIQAILGHGWPTQSSLTWRRSVDINGNLVRFCVEDENYKKYMYDVVKMFAEEKPCFILGDDDIRAFNGKALCFCDHHTKIFNERTGSNYTPDELRAAVAASKVGEPVFEAFEQMRKEYVYGVCSIIRRAIDDVDPSIPGGCCMPGWETMFHGEPSRIMAGAGNPLMLRVANSNYDEQSPKDFVRYIAMGQSYRQAYADIPYIFDESDTFPHHRYSRSARSMHAKLCSSIFSGMTGSKIWFVNCHRFGMPIDRKYTETLATYKHYYQALAGAVENSRVTGSVMPSSRKVVNWSFTDTAEKFIDMPNFLGKFFGHHGIPFDTGFELTRDEIYILAGAKHVARFSDEEIKTMLAGKVFIDGKAALALAERGFAKYMGVSVEPGPFFYINEVWGKDGESLPMRRFPDMPKFTALSDKVEIISSFVTSGSAYAPGCEFVAPATTFFVNELGGRVVVAGFNEDVTWVYPHPARKKWLIAVWEKLNGGKLPFYLPEYQNLILLTRKCADNSDLLFIANTNFDPMENLRICCAKTPEKVAFLNLDGKWEDIGFTVKDGEIVLDKRLECYEIIVLKVW